MNIRLLMLAASAVLTANLAYALKPISNDKELNHEIANNKLVFVKYFSDTCPPCKQMAPIVQELANSHAGKIAFIEVNVNKFAGTPTVFSIPTFHLYKDGKKVYEHTGAMAKAALDEKIKHHLGLVGGAGAVAAVVSGAGAVAGGAGAVAAGKGLHVKGKGKGLHGKGKASAGAVVGASAVAGGAGTKAVSAGSGPLTAGAPGAGMHGKGKFGGKGRFGRKPGCHKLWGCKKKQ